MNVLTVFRADCLVQYQSCLQPVVIMEAFPGCQSSLSLPTVPGPDEEGPLRVCYQQDSNDSQTNIAQQLMRGPAQVLGSVRAVGRLVTAHTTLGQGTPGPFLCPSNSANHGLYLKRGL